MTSVKDKMPMFILTVIAVTVFATLLMIDSNSAVRAEYRTDHATIPIDSDTSVENKIDIGDVSDSTTVETHCGWHMRIKYIYKDNGTTSWWERIVYWVWKC